MDTVAATPSDAFQEPAVWPALQPERVPQSNDWTDWRPAALVRAAERGAVRAMGSAPVRATGSAPVREADPRARLPQAPLTPLARQWLRDLPFNARPGLTVQRHPHVVNRLALAWPDRELLAACFRELLLSDRLDRQGFAKDVLSELLALQAYSAEPRRA